MAIITPLVIVCVCVMLWFVAMGDSLLCIIINLEILQLSGLDVYVKMLLLSLHYNHSQERVLFQPLRANKQDYARADIHAWVTGIFDVVLFTNFRISNRTTNYQLSINGAYSRNLPQTNTFVCAKSSTKLNTC